jgi:hypothetical protein
MGGAPGYPAHAPRWGSAVQAQAAGRSRIGAVAADCSTSAPTAPAHCRARSGVGARAGSPPLGWQPSRFLTDRSEAERGFQLAERLGSVNAAAAELGTSWPSLRKASQRHGLGMPARNPEAVRQRAIQAARQRIRPRAAPALNPVFAALNPGALPARERSAAELYEWVRREEQYAILGANVVVELYSESRPRPAHHPGVGDHPTGRPRLSAGRPTRQPCPAPPRRPDGPVPGAGGGGRCPLTFAGPPDSERSSSDRALCRACCIWAIPTPLTAANHGRC